MHNSISSSKRITRRFCTALLVATLILLQPVAVNAAPAVPSLGPSDPKEVSSFIDGFFKRPEVKSMLTGAIVTVVKDDKVLLNRGYGFADLERKIEVDPDRTVFRVASISKTFTATAIMQLAEQNKVDLDKDIGSYLNGFVIPNKTGVPLTLKNLMTHTTGFDYTDIRTTRDKYSLQDYVKENVPTVIRKPGEAFRYDNYAYSLMGDIVENMTGKPFEKYVADHIFQPLGMKNSSFVITPTITKQLAISYDAANRPIPPYNEAPENSPEGGMFSTGSDMAQFMLAQLNGGKAGDSGILQEQSVQEMQKYSVAIHPDLPGIGYGFESSYPSNNNGQYVVDKAGDLPGFHADFWLLPEHKTGLFIVLNSDRSGIRQMLYQSFMDHYFPQSKKKCR